MALLKKGSPLNHTANETSHATQIWQAGVDAVRADRLVRSALHFENHQLSFDREAIDVKRIRQIVVVGGGKGGAEMALAVEAILGPEIVDEKLSGWVNVPDDCMRSTKKIHLHPARPAGVNEPTAAGIAGSDEILRRVSQLQADDLCIVLLSGGGSALLPAPQPPITLDHLLQVTRLLMHRGATIHELNTVRTWLSRMKGGGLARHCAADTLWGLIVSDVVGDPISIIASGPTVETESTALEAVEILKRMPAEEVPEQVIDFLQQQATKTPPQRSLPAQLTNRIIGNNAVAVSAAADKAKQLGYEVLCWGSDNQGEASEEGQRFALRCQQLRDADEERNKRLCIISGGEPVVDLGPQAGKGGRNQQFVLAAVTELFSSGMTGITILSGGTDGEDGPTDAAGAVADASLIQRAQAQQLDPHHFLSEHDAYHFFDPLDGLLQTGPTQTNVMDLRVAIVE